MSRADMQLLGRDLTTQAAALAAGELSSVELVGQVLAAIEASQPVVNSCIATAAPLPPLEPPGVYPGRCGLWQAP